MSNSTPAWVGITYLIYIAMMMLVLFGGTGYAVFVLGQSGWWFVPAFLIATCSYRPGRWKEIVTGDTGMWGVDGKPGHDPRDDFSEANDPLMRTARWRWPGTPG